MCPGWGLYATALADVFAAWEMCDTVLAQQLKTAKKIKSVPVARERAVGVCAGHACADTGFREKFRRKNSEGYPENI